MGKRNGSTNFGTKRLRNFGKLLFAEGRKETSKNRTIVAIKRSKARKGATKDDKGGEETWKKRGGK